MSQKQFCFQKVRFNQLAKKISSEKAVTQFIKQRENFVEPVETVLGVDRENNKQDTIQYVPILSTLNVLLSHQDVLSLVLKPEQENSKSGYLHTFRDGKAFKNNDLVRTSQNCLEIILHHDDFGTVNPLGNKVSKYKISAFYFVLGNIPSKFRSRLNDINLLLISLTYFTVYLKIWLL